MAPDDEVDADLDDLDSDWAVPDLWPLHVALAWVLTRDEPFTSRVLRSRLKPIKTNDDSLRLFEIGQALPTIIADESEAWSQLRAAIAGRGVQAFGIQCDFRNRVPGTITREPSQLLPAEQASSLRCETEVRHGQTHVLLRPDDWLLAGGRWWRDVKVDRDDLIKAFPWKTSQPKGFGELPASHGRTAVKIVIHKLYGPDGPPSGLRVKDRNTAINKALEQQKSSSASDSTIRRAIKEIRHTGRTIRR